MKCIEDEIPFDLPDGWAWARLESISAAISDGDHQPPPQTSSGIPFLVISNVSDGKLSFENTRFVSENYYNLLSSTRRPQKGDLLFTVTGSYGIPILIDRDMDFCFQRHIAIIRPCIVSNYYLYIILGSAYIKEICDYAATGVAQKTVSLTTLRKILIPLAPRNEQDRIYTQAKKVLSTIDGISSDSEELQMSIRIAKSKILDLAIRGQLVPQNPNDEPASVLLDRIRAEKEGLIKQGKIKRDKKESVIFKGEDNSYYEKYGISLPAGWAVTNLETFLSYEQPTKYIVSDTNYKSTYKTPVLTAGKSFVLGYTNEKDNIFSDLPVIIFDDFTTESKYVDFPFKVKSSAMKILRINTELILPEYAYFLVQTTEVDHENHQRYWISVFSQEEVGLPPLEEQKRIVAAVDYCLNLLGNIP